jgi:hypothetical protein
MIIINNKSIKKINLQGGGSSSYILGIAGNCRSGVVGVA